MFNDFNFLNYWNTKNKLRKLREMINRIYGHYLLKVEKVNKLESSINQVENMISQLEGQLLPDLAIDWWSITQLTYNEDSYLISVEIEVINEGKGDAEASHATIEMTDGWSRTIEIPSLKVNESYESPLIYHTVKNTGSYLIILIADSRNEIKEIKEGEDNEVDVPFTIYPE